MESPHTQTFNLDLPPGAALEPTKGGGAAITDGEETLVDVPPPTAIDAGGAKVPVSMEVSGDSLVLTVSPGESAQLPILLDPLFQTYEWASSTKGKNGICSNSFEMQIQNPCNRREEWGSEVHDQAGTLPFPIDPENQFWGTFGLPNGTPGLYIRSGGEGTIRAGDSGSWLYAVPRYFTDPEKYKDSQGHGETPTSFISHMTFWNLRWNAFSSHLSPYLFAGIWDAEKQAWVSTYSHEGLNGHSLENAGYHYEFANGGNQADTHAKVGYLTVQATETQSGQIADAYVGSASIELGDNDLPAVVVPSGPSQWVNQTAVPVPFTAADSGLGVQSLTSYEHPDDASPHWKTSYGCIGVGDAACPRKWESTTPGHPALKYEPALMPTGIDYLNVVAEDPVGNRSAASNVPIKVDHTAPEVSLSGPLTEQATLGTKRGSYVLQLHAVDGTAEHPQSGVAKAVIKVDGQTVYESAPGCATKNCEMSREWTLESDHFSPGQHTVEVVATDAVACRRRKN